MLSSFTLPPLVPSLYKFLLNTKEDILCIFMNILKIFCAQQKIEMHLCLEQHAGG